MKLGPSNDLQRINVVGTSGSGKSTLTKNLAQVLNSKVVELDALAWDRNWTLVSDEVLFNRLAKELESDSWVLDGNYTRTIPIKWNEVQTVIWIDIPFILNLAQSMKRTFLRSLTNEELWPGTNNRETFRKSFFDKESIILWMIQTHGKMRSQYEQLSSDPQYSHINFIRLRSRSQIKKFLSEVRNLVEQETIS